MTPEEEAALTPEIKAERVRGSKWVLVSEQAMIMSVWSCKAVMLILYRTLTYVHTGLNCWTLEADCAGTG